MRWKSAKVACAASAIASRRAGTHYSYSYAYNTNAHRSAEVGGDGGGTGKFAQRIEGQRLHEAHQRRQGGKSFLQQLHTARAAGEHGILRMEDNTVYSCRTCRNAFTRLKLLLYSCISQTAPIQTGHHKGFLPDIILLTLVYATINNIGESFESYQEFLPLYNSQCPHLNVLNFPPVGWVFRRFRCVQIFFKLRYRCGNRIKSFRSSFSIAPLYDNSDGCHHSYNYGYTVDPMLQHLGTQLKHMKSFILTAYVPSHIKLLIGWMMPGRFRRIHPPPRH